MTNGTQIRPNSWSDAQIFCKYIYFCLRNHLYDKIVCTNFIKCTMFKKAQERKWKPLKVLPLR